MTLQRLSFPRRFALPGGVYNAVPPRIVFGPGSLARVAEEAAHYGAERALVVSTPGRGTLAGRVAEILGSRCVGILPEAVSQVPIELALQSRAHAQAMGADCLVSVGGGAAIGLGKGIALGLPLPIIAVPTTYSGSEMTGFCGITIDGIKRMHTSRDMLASSVIYDPELTLSLPLDASAASAMNALAHCIDGIYVPTVSPMMALAAIEGASVVMDALPRVARCPDDLSARTDLLYGAYLGGAALTGGFALQHGVAHVLGGSFGISHGLSHALVLPHVAAYNTRYARAALAPLRATLGDGDLGGALFDLLTTTGLPTSLAALGLPREALDRATEITVETDNGLNPGPVTREGVRQILEDAFEGRRPRPLA